MENIKSEFDNQDRSRYYGLRKGDTIKVLDVSGRVWGESKVLDYVAGDNNRVIIASKNGTPIDWVAEWCEIITKVEEQS